MTCLFSNLKKKNRSLFTKRVKNFIININKTNIYIINIQICELFKFVLCLINDDIEDKIKAKKKNCIPFGKSIPLRLHEKYDQFIRPFEKNKL
jgi:hypothetical protein